MSKDMNGTYKQLNNGGTDGLEKSGPGIKFDDLNKNGANVHKVL